MSKLTFSAGFLLLSTIFNTSCHKTEIADSSAYSFQEEAKIFFTQQIENTASTVKNTERKANRNPRIEKHKALNWNKGYETIVSGNPTMIIPVEYDQPFLIKTNFSGDRFYSSNEITKLFISKDNKKQLKAELVTYFPDSNYKKYNNQVFSGIVAVEDWAGNLMKEFKYDGKGGIEKLDLNRFYNAQYNRLPTNTANLSIITVCYEISGYNYSPVNDEYTYWSYSAGCSSMFLPDAGGGGGSDGGGGGGGADYGGGGGGGGVNDAPVAIVDGGNNPIYNIENYIKCFRNIPGSDNTYQVRLCVDQPVPGCREPWGFSGNSSAGSGNPLFAGHTFLILTQTSPMGTTTRNIGFYPVSRVSPYNPNMQGQLNNDEEHAFNVSLNINLTNSEFTMILNFITQGNNIGFNYDLNSNNCTNFALNALSNSGINLPRTYCTWLNGGGLSPGNLGEDIMNMDLAPNMTRTTFSGSHPNQGSCN